MFVYVREGERLCACSDESYLGGILLYDEKIGILDECALNFLIRSAESVHKDGAFCIIAQTEKRGALGINVFTSFTQTLLASPSIKWPFFC